MAVIELKTSKLDAVSSLVEMLEESLEQAKSGEFRSGAMFFVRKSGAINTRISDGADLHYHIAACNYLIHDMVHNSVE